MFNKVPSIIIIIFIAIIILVLHTCSAKRETSRKPHDLSHSILSQIQRKHSTEAKTEVARKTEFKIVILSKLILAPF